MQRQISGNIDDILHVGIRPPVQTDSVASLRKRDDEAPGWADPRLVASGGLAVARQTAGPGPRLSHATPAAWHVRFPSGSYGNSLAVLDHELATPVA